MSKLARRRRRRLTKNPSRPKRNPPLLTDLAEWVLPGFAGFAATRLLTRIAQGVIEKKVPKAAKHAGAIASIGSFLASWFLGDRVKLIAKYHTPVTVGAAIAAGQSLLQLYAPNKLGWIVSDANGNHPATAKAVQAPPQQRSLPDHMEEIDDDPRWYTYNESGYAGSLGKAPPMEPQIKAPTNEPLPIDDPQEGDDELAAGIFGN